MLVRPTNLAYMKTKFNYRIKTKRYWLFWLDVGITFNNINEAIYYINTDGGHNYKIVSVHA